DIVIGPDGNFWITGHFSPDDTFDIPTVSRLTMKTVLTPHAMPGPGQIPDAIVNGPDGNLWFTVPRFNIIGRITPAGVMTQFPLPSNGGPLDIVPGKDNNLWFTEPGTNAVGRITYDGKITELAVPIIGRGLYGITVGPDKNLWITDIGDNCIWQMSTKGVTKQFALPNSLPRSPYNII